ncbi:MAG: lycopene cyclase domain-containing protein [Bacteroidota bacterium]|nr:lycopene cyclase domain-containing protein [Bacteroidota bacterium]
MLETKWLYIILNLFTISIPLFRSFESRVGFYKKLPSLFKSILIVSSVFLIWDVYFTHRKIWGFTPQYVSGIDFFGLPLGEYLFFLTVPYACIFIYECLKFFKPKGILSSKTTKAISLALMIFSFIMAFYGLFEGKWYTSSTFLFLGIAISLVQFLAESNWLPRFYESYFIALLPFFMKNGILTGMLIDSQVVWYNDEHNIGFRLGTIPFEDIFYGMLLILGTLYFYENFESKKEVR